VTHSPVLIQPFVLSKFENKILKPGKFSRAWEGKNLAMKSILNRFGNHHILSGLWMKQPSVKDTVAIKQLLPEFEHTKLREFMESVNRFFFENW